MSKVKKVLKSKLFQVAAPLALNYFAPGLGSAVGAGLGVSGAAGSALGGALIGGGLGAVTGGGLKGSLLGAASGGAGGYLSGGGLSNTIGKAGTLGAGGMGPPTPGSGILGSVGRTTGIGVNTISGGGNVSAYGGGKNLLSNVLSGGIGKMGNDDAEEALLKAQKNRLSAYAPYANQTFTPGDLTQDPGYQFRLSQGNQALDRSQAARGNYFSGNALKEAQDYGQGLADSTYNDAFQRWMAEQGQGINVANAQSGIYDDIGNVRANATINNSNLLSRGLSGILGGSGFTNTGAAMDGLDIEALKRRLGMSQYA